METTTELDNLECEEVSKDKLVDDLKTLTHDTGVLLKTQVKAARNRLVEAMEKAKPACQNLKDKTAASAKATDQYIQAHPYPAISMAFVLGLAIGLLVRRK